jgi:hypothetical protein
MDVMKTPEETARYREELAERLEIIKHGSLSTTGQTCG